MGPHFLEDKSDCFVVGSTSNPEILLKIKDRIGVFVGFGFRCCGVLLLYHTNIISELLIFSHNIIILPFLF